MIHGLDAGAVGLGGDVAVLEINLHPFVGGLLRLLLQYLPAQEFLVLEIEGGNPGEALVLKQGAEANGLEMPLDVRHPLVGVLQPCALAGAHGNVSDGREAAAAGSRGKPFRVAAPELHVDQPAVADVVVVGRGQGLDDAGLDPLPAPGQVPHAQGAQDAAHRRLAGVPAAGVHRRIDRAVAVGLSLQVEHPAGLGRDDALVSLHPAERSLLPEAGDGAVDQPRVELRQGIVIQAPVRHVAGTEGLDEDIGPGGQLDGLLAALPRY